MNYTDLKTYVYRLTAFTASILLSCALSCAGTEKKPIVMEPVPIKSIPERVVVKTNTTDLDSKSPEKDVRIDREMYLNFILASLNIIRGDYKAAKDYLSEVIENDPDSIYLNNKMAIILEKLGDTKGAIKYALKCLQIDPNDIESHLLLAELYFISGDKASEQKEYETALGLDPQQQRVRMTLVTVLIRNGLFNEALGHLDELIKQNPALTIAYYYRGRVQIELGNYKEAEKEYLHTLELDDNMEPALFDLASLYQMEKRFDEAIKLYEKLVSLYPANRIVKERLIALYNSLGQTDNTNRLLEDIKRGSEPGDPIRQTLGLFYLREGKLAESIAELDLIVTAWPKDNKSRYYLAIAYEENGEPEKALNHFRMIQVGSDYFINSQIHMAYIMDARGESDEAINVIKKAIEVDNKNLELYMMLASMFESKTRYNEAMEVINEGLKYDDKNIELIFRLGIVLDKSGDKEGSIKQMRRILEIDPDNADSLNYIGYTYAEKGINLDEAMDLIQKALKIKPDSAFIIDSLGWVYYQKGLYDEALDSLEKAFSLLSDDPTITEHLGDVYLKKSNYKRSLEMYQKALTLKPQYVDKILKKIEEVKKFIE
jgi:tetratricopeptide (TPR) repeat protein